MAGFVHGGQTKGMFGMMEWKDENGEENDIPFMESHVLIWDFPVVMRSNGIGIDPLMIFAARAEINQAQ
ncbi:hypothetical protein Tco_0650791 [Tanacetum coccineum]